MPLEVVNETPYPTSFLRSIITWAAHSFGRCKTTNMRLTFYEIDHKAYPYIDPQGFRSVVKLPKKVMRRDCEIVKALKLRGRPVTNIPELFIPTGPVEGVCLLMTAVELEIIVAAVQHECRRTQQLTPMHSNEYRAKIIAEIHDNDRRRTLIDQWSASSARRAPKPVDKAAKKAKHAEKMLKLWTRRRKIAMTTYKKWEKKVKYYRRKLGVDKRQDDS